MFKTTPTIEDRYIRIIDELIKAGYGWKKYAENVKAQGWASNKQKDALCNMYNKLQSVKMAGERGRSHGGRERCNYCYDSDISDYEAYQSGDYF